MSQLAWISIVVIISLAVVAGKLLHQFVVNKGYFKPAAYSRIIHSIIQPIKIKSGVTIN